MLQLPVYGLSALVAHEIWQKIVVLCMDVSKSFSKGHLGVKCVSNGLHIPVTMHDVVGWGAQKSLGLPDLPNSVTVQSSPLCSFERSPTAAAYICNTLSLCYTSFLL